MTFARRFVLSLTALAALAGGLATLRLAAVVAATPGGVMLVEYAPLIDETRTVNAATAGRAELVARFISDPALIRGRMGICEDASVAGVPGAEATARCLAVIDDALKASPAAGELWAYRATFLARSGEFGAPMLAALRNSYATMPREGWLASRRVVLAMKLFPLLPEDLQASARSDLDIVLRYPELSWPLVDAYTSDFALRAAAKPVLDSVPQGLIEPFLARIRSRLS